MNENIKALLEKVSGNDEMLAKFSACKSVDEAYELAQGLVSGYTKEEFIEAMTALDAAENGDISDADLAAAAGGEGEEDTAAYETMDFELPKSAEESMISGAWVSVIATKVSDSIVDSATAVGNSVAKSATEVANSIAKSATEVANSVSKASKEVGKATKKAFSI